MPRHVVVDGSNLATEGRTLPSLKQLNDAVLSYLQDHPDDLITVVVDATFGHRIESSEVPEFDAAIENNELVCPPAGAIGRGDAFVLSIANKADAVILSNDSFQEFHGDHPWLFDEGRLIGGKPVPHIGWVFVNRAPVRGPTSRQAVRDAKKGGGRSRDRDDRKAASRPSRAASEPMPTPKAPPPVRRQPAPVAATAPAGETAAHAGQTAAPPHQPAGTAAKARKPASRAAKVGTGHTAAPEPSRHVHAPAPAKHEPINDLLPFLGFVEAHPVGSPIDATIESYSSHGAYAMAGDVRCYAPLRFLGHPAPRSAREVLAMGESASFVVVSFNPARRGIDVALPGFQPADVVLVETPVAKPAKAAKKAAKKAAAPEPVVEAAAVPPAPSPRRGKPAAVISAAQDVDAAPARRGAKKAAAHAAPIPAPIPASGPTPVPPRVAKGAPKVPPAVQAPPAAKAAKATRTAKATTASAAPPAGPAEEIAGSTAARKPAKAAPVSTTTPGDKPAKSAKAAKPAKAAKAAPASTKAPAEGTTADKARADRAPASTKARGDQAAKPSSKPSTKPSTKPAKATKAVPS